MADQKKKKGEINWISFYLFTIRWVNIKMNISSWYDSTYYLSQWIMGIRLGVATIAALVLVIGMSVAALLFVVKLVIIYMILEILVVFLMHQACKNDGVYDTPYEKLSPAQKLLFKNAHGARYADALTAYKDMLKREQNEGS